MQKTPDGVRAESLGSNERWRIRWEDRGLGSVGLGVVATLSLGVGNERRDFLSGNQLDWLSRGHGILWEDLILVVNHKFVCSYLLSNPLRK